MAATLRRSTRHQPQVRPVRTIQVGDWSHQWSGSPLYTRPTQPIDLHQGEPFHSQDDESGEHNRPLSMETVFYPACTRSLDSKRAKKGKRSEKKSETEIFSVGDTVFIHSNNKTPNVGVIVALWDTRFTRGEPDDSVKFESMKVKVHWFIRPGQTARVSARREHVYNEIYFALNEVATLAPSDIIAHCNVSSQPPISAKGVTTSPSKGVNWEYEDDESETDEPEWDTFFCGLALDAERGLFYEFRWEEHRDAALKYGPQEPGKAWKVEVNSDASKKRKGKEKGRETEGNSEIEESSGNESEDAFSQESEEEDLDSDPNENEAAEEDKGLSGPDNQEEEDVPAGGSKKRRKTQLSNPTTPRKRRKLAVPTPHSKAALRARRKQGKGRGKGKLVGSRRHNLTIVPPRATTDYAQLQDLPPDPLLRAMHVLHVGARPDALPCREDEYVEVMGAILGLVEEGSGGCVYISGVPGTGKTATVHAVVRELKTMAERSETNPFTYVEINGLKIPEPSTAYTLLWEAVSGHDIVADGHLEVSSKEALKKLNHHFAAGVRAGPGGHACVVLMDELDQLVTLKQDVIYNFFNWPSLAGSKLIVIAVANTHDLPERVMSGKVRSRLGMVRINFNPYKGPQLQRIVQARLDSAKEGLNQDQDGALEVIKPDAIKFVAMKVSGVSGDARRILDVCRRAVELIRAIPRARVVEIPHVKQVLDAMQNSPTAAYLRDCSLHERIMLASLLKCVKREGVDEIRWGDVTHQHFIYMNSLTGEDDAKRKPTDVELALVLDSLVACRAMLIEEGIAASRKHQRDRKVVLNIEAGEVERVLSEMGGANWKNALGM